MYAEEAIELLGLRPGFLKRWEKTLDKALRIFKLATKKAYKLRALETHPDRNHGDSTEFIKVGEAYETLQKADEEFIKELIDSLPSSQPRERVRKIYLERRGGGKVKVSYASPCGISTTFVNMGYAIESRTREERRHRMEIVVAALKRAGMVPSYETPGSSPGAVKYKIVEV
jgi:alpha-ketoglutarate-dependent taurine dioxygenase